MAATKDARKHLEDDPSLRGHMKDSGKTAAELDSARRSNMAYEYLCHLEEARKWMEACVKSDLPPASELEGALRNGVIVARLALFFAPDKIKERQIYDIDEKVYQERGLTFRHTDNIARWTQAMRSVGFPEIFYPEVTDLYDKKNMPRVVYCIHALSRYLFQLGIGPKIQDLHGIAQFTEEEINKMDAELEAAGVQMPTFGSIGGVLAKELGEEETVDTALEKIKAAIAAGDVEQLLNSLRITAAGISGVDDAAGADYLAQLQGLLAGLTQEGVQAAVRDVNRSRLEASALDGIAQAVQAGDADALLAALKAAPFDLEIDPAAKDAYLAALTAALAQGKLTPTAVQQAVAKANAEHKAAQALSAALAQLNAAVQGEDAEATMAAMKSPTLALADVDDAGAFQYHAQLKVAREEKGADLDVADVQSCVAAVNTIAEENANHAAAIFSLHEAVRQKDVDRTLAALQDPYCHVSDVVPAYKGRYLDNLSETLAALQAQGSGPSKWRQYTTDAGRTYYFNKETNVTQWVAPIEEVVMSLEEVQASVDKANADGRRWDQLSANQDMIVRLQSHIRGHLARVAFRARMAFLHDQLSPILKIQAHVRGMLQRRRYQARLQYFRDNLPAIVRIQAAWKGFRARRQYKNLTKVRDPPVATVRRFLHLLDQSDSDLAEELQLQQLKEKVVLEIKQGNKLEADLNQMDIKIGLLVKNRINLEDVVKQSRLLKRQQRTGSQPALPVSATGINALNKDARHKLEAYQALFYLLQTQPLYLARLIFVEQPLEAWSAHKAQTFLLGLTQAVYNFASNAREQYLMFKLFRAALEYEVRERYNSVKEFTTGNPTVIRLVMGHHRGQGGGNYLAKVLGPFVEKLVKEEDLDLNIDPVEIYKSWRGREELTTGQKSALPFEVSREAALEYPAVRQAMEKLTERVISLCNDLLTSIVGSAKDLPYGLRVFCREMYVTLRERFASEAEDDVIKALGNLLYYRYINPALIAPESDVQVQVDDQARKGLAQIAKILQIAAAGQYDDSIETPINQFIKSGWARFRVFFLEAAKVPSLEEHFNVDEYSEVVLLTRPAIVISYHNMYWVHRMVHANIEALAPTAQDPLRVVLTDLGEPIDESAELGFPDSAEYATNQVDMALTLVNKFEVPEQEDSSVKALFIRTKRMIIDLIRFRGGKSLPELLTSKPTKDEEEAYAASVDKRKKEYEKAKKEDSDRPIAQTQTFASLAELQAKGLVNVEELTRQGKCKKENNYQDLLNAVAQDIRNQRQYRKQRKQELAKITQTLAELRRKQELYSTTIGEYDRYVNDCMKHMGKARPRNKGFAGLFGGNKQKTVVEDTWVEGRSIKYSAARLKEKGVLISIDDMSDTQLRLVTIEIVSSSVKGVFEVSASAMLKSAKMDLLLQELLELQYQNTATMRLFDSCTVNVNLLLFLINKKFLNA